MKNATAILNITFPDGIRSSTYGINYGRILGEGWMARSASWYA